MQNQSYEDYIRSILGYTDVNDNIYYQDEPYRYNNAYSYQPDYRNFSVNNSELEACYPEIYKLVYPMVKKACGNMSIPADRNVVETMTDEIYSAIESRDEIQLNISLSNVTTTQNRAESSNNNLKRPDVTVEENGGNREVRHQNTGIRDIIKILILRELLGRPNFNPRPPMPPPRPPRPPIRPRDF